MLSQLQGGQRRGTSRLHLFCRLAKPRLFRIVLRNTGSRGLAATCCRVWGEACLDARPCQGERIRHVAAGTAAVPLSGATQCRRAARGLRGECLAHENGDDLGPESLASREANSLVKEPLKVAA